MRVFRIKIVNGTSTKGGWKFHYRNSPPSLFGVFLLLLLTEKGVNRGVVPSTCIVSAPCRVGVFLVSEVL